jgi:hypothetical protein
LAAGAASNLAAGEYYVSLRTTASVAPFDYSLRFEIVAP